MNNTSTPAVYSNGTAMISSAAFSADFYSSATAEGANHIGRLTSTIGTNATTNVPQQLGFRTFGGNSFCDRLNELDVTTGLNVVTMVPEPSTYALLAIGGLVLIVVKRRRLAG